MTDFEVFALLLIPLVLCITNWRLGVCICLLVGFIQDPLRKLTPGEPIYFTALVGAPLVATIIGAYIRNVRFSFRPLHSFNKVLRKPLNVFIVFVGLQSLAAVIRTGSPIIGAIGALSYMAPLPGILLAYKFSRSEMDMTRMIRVYLSVGILMVSGIYLSYAGYDWPVLKSVGEGLFIYSTEKGRLDLYSGFLRSPEIAAWHAAAAVCLLLVLAQSLKRNAIFKASAGVLVIFLLSALLLTGRRKFLVEIFLFASVYALLLIFFLKSTIKSALIFKSAVLLAGGLLVGSVVYMFLASDQSTSVIRPYFERGMSVKNDVPDRVSVMTLESFQYVIAQNGILGSGAGTGSQGSQYFGGGADIVGAAAEGGLGKVLAELGIPGLLLLSWLAISFGRYIWSIVMYITHTKDVDPTLAKLVFGLMAFLTTNAFVFTIAHQVFGDPFVLIILGFFVGFVVAMPKMQQKKDEDARRMLGEIEGRPITDGRPATDDGRRATDKGRIGPAFPVSGRPSPVLAIRPSLLPEL